MCPLLSIILNIQSNYNLEVEPHDSQMFFVLFFAFLLSSFLSLFFLIILHFNSSIILYSFLPKRFPDPHFSKCTWVRKPGILTVTILYTMTQYYGRSRAADGGFNFFKLTARMDRVRDIWYKQLCLFKLMVKPMNR